MTFAMHSKRTSQTSSSAAAFTLIELMVVIVIMTLMLAVAIPALRSIMGTRSNEVAMNKISAYLGNARLQAIGLVQEEGVFFYLDPQTQFVTMTTVYTTLPVQGDPVTSTGLTIHYVDLVPNQTTETLPNGVGLAFLNSSYVPGSTATGATAEYSGYTPLPGGGTAPFFAGLILFDTQGRAVTVPYGCRCQTINTSGPATTSGTSGMGQLIYGVGAQPSQATYVPGGNSSFAPVTAFVFTLYTPEAYSNAGYTLLQPPPATPAPNWLDTNGLQILVNRSNGTLLKSE